MFDITRHKCLRWIAVASWLAAAPTSLAGAQPTPVAAPTPPAAVGVSGQVSKWLQVRAEYRGRWERFAGGSYKPDNGDGYLLDRFRFNVTVAPSPVVKGVVQFQDARALDKSTGFSTPPLRDTFDLRLAYGEFGGARNMLRAGRQELVFGEQRLLGHVNWVNGARSFDGVHVTIARQPFKFDVFAASVVVLRPDTSVSTAPFFSKSGNGNMLYGFYGSSTRVIPKATVEPYFFWRKSVGLRLETGGTGDIHQATIGARIAGKLPRDFDYVAEVAGQTGSVATDEISAWAGHWTAGKTFAATATKPRPFLEFNYATGDSDSHDGVRGTFDQLYPTGHDKIGLADQVGWKNVDHLRGGVELKPRRQWQVSTSYHSFWLASATDALYAANGSAVARSTAGTAGRHVGQELDGQAVYIYSPQLQIGAGFARVLPGEFLKATTPGEAYNLGYFTVTYVFVGDKPGPPPGGAR